jgi:hypothetical protein
MLRRMMMAGAGSLPPSGNTDEFDTDSLSQYVQYATIPVTYTISGGDLRAVGGGGYQSILTRTDAGAFADGEVSCVLRQANDAGLALRVMDANNYLLAAIYDSSGTVPNRVVLYSRNGGAFTQIANATVAFPRGTPKAFSFGIVGTAATVKMDGSAVLTATVTTNTAAGLCGMRANDGTQIFESFSWP